MAFTPILQSEEIGSFIEVSEQEVELVNLILLTCSMEIESYCKRVIRERSISEIHEGRYQQEIFLREYPVQQVQRLWCDKNGNFNDLNQVNSELYNLNTPSMFSGMDSPSSILLVDDIRFPKGINAVKVEYLAGYSDETMPDDIKGAFVELVSWTLQRYRTRQIGVNGLINQQGRAVQNTFEKKMPLSVEAKLRGYRRRKLL